MTRIGKMIRVKSRDGFEFDAFRADPDGAPRGGVVVIQEIFGLSDHIREMTERFAAAGYLAIAPSMFDRAAPGFVLNALTPENLARGRELALANGRENAMNDIGGVIDVLKDAGPLFITGFCYGGTMSWVAASRHKELKAASCYYGGGIPDLLDLEPQCPTVLHFGRRDGFIPMEKVDKIRAAKPMLPIHVYEAGHGFCRKSSADYDEDSDTLAFKRTLDLFAHP